MFAVEAGRGLQDPRKFVSQRQKQARLHAENNQRKAQGGQEGGQADAFIFAQLLAGRGVLAVGVHRGGGLSSSSSSPYRLRGEGGVAASGRRQAAGRLAGEIELGLGARQGAEAQWLYGKMGGRE